MHKHPPFKRCYLWWVQWPAASCIPPSAPPTIFTLGLDGMEWSERARGSGKSDAFSVGIFGGLRICRRLRLKPPSSLSLSCEGRSSKAMELFPNGMLRVSQSRSFIILRRNCSQGLGKVSSYSTILGSTHKVPKWNLRLEKKNCGEIAYCAMCFGNKRSISIKGARWRVRFYFFDRCEDITEGLASLALSAKQIVGNARIKHKTQFKTRV